MPKIRAFDPVKRELLVQLFTQAQTASIAAAIGVVVCTLVFFVAQPGFAPLAWGGIAALATLQRFVLFRQFFASEIAQFTHEYWIKRHSVSVLLVGVAWGGVALLPLDGAPAYARYVQTLIPPFILMAAITSYGVCISQYLVLWGSATLTVVISRLFVSGADAIAEVTLFVFFSPLLAVTAKRYNESITESIKARFRSDELVEKLTEVNKDLQDRNTILGRQQDVIEQEEALAKHVFKQLVVGGDRKLPGIHTWNQSMGTLSGDLTQTVRGPAGQSYIFLGDFTGHGLPAALGALPASSVFLAMASKGLPLDAIATELNAKLHQLLPVGYFCCGVLLELTADHRTLHVWNGGLPDVLIRRGNKDGYERIASHGLPLGVSGADQFDASTVTIHLQAGDLVYAYTDGLTEAVDKNGEMWGGQRLEEFLAQPDLEAPKLPALIDAVLQHVDLAPPTDDISVVEIEAPARLGIRSGSATVGEVAAR